MYTDYHVYYSADDKFEAIEIFGNVKVNINGHKVFPGNINDLGKIIPTLVRDEYAAIDKKNSIGITPYQDDPEKIEAILFGCKGYYD